MALPGSSVTAHSPARSWGIDGYGTLDYSFFGETQDSLLANEMAGDAWMRRPQADLVELLAPAPSGLVIHGPRGLRVEGATIADVAELFRRLA